MEQKVASAAAAGYPVAFIPAIAAGGVTPVAGGAQMAAPTAQQVTAQTPVRPATYA
jgi:copper homeostasis protein CutC